MIATDEIYAVEFAGNRLDQVPDVELHNHDFNRLPARDIKIHKLARRNLSIITSSEYVDKQVPVFMEVCGGNRSQTEATIIELKALMQVQNGALRVLQGGVETEYTATLQEFTIEWDGPKAYCSLVFLASTPVGESVEVEDLVTITGITGSSSSATFTVSGSFTAQPLITLIINTVTGGTAATINVYNAVTNQGITITEDFVNGDVVEINSKELRVLLNGANIDYQGLFPSFPPGSQQIAYSDTFTTRSVDLSATYNVRTV